MAAFILYVIATLVAPYYYSGYDWVRQPISDLGALTSSSRLAWIMIWSLGSAFALLSVALAATLFERNTNRLLRWGVYTFALMTWISLGYTMFPLSEGGHGVTMVDVLHLYLVTPLVMLTTFVSLILIALGGRKTPHYRPLALLATATLLLVMVGGFGIGIGGEATFGLFERVTIYPIMAFTAVVGVYGFKERDDANYINMQRHHRA